MTDNRDIDAILSSLDTLLGKSDNQHNIMSTKAIKLEQHSNDLEAISEATKTNRKGDDGLDKLDHQQTWNLPRVVLTEDMMIDNPQFSLPLAKGIEDETMQQAIVDDKYDEDEHIIHLHKQNVEKLLSLVSLDISNYLEQQLPTLIKQSLHAHLSDMQHKPNENNKTSDDT